jgi:hypothetical protein
MTTMPREIKQYVVAEEDGDFTPKEMDLLAYKIAEWFNSDDCDRTYDDPLQAAKEKIRECLLGITSDGKRWTRCPETFALRIKSKTMYDMETGWGKPVEKRKSPASKKYHENAPARAGAAAVTKSNPVMSTFDQDKYMRDTTSQILKTYPELDTPAHRPNVERLSLLYLQQEVISRELRVNSSFKRQQEAITSLNTLQRTIQDTQKSLDIHPDQLRKRMDAQRSGTLGDLVELLDGDEDFAKRERRWSLTLALQLWYMANHPNGRGDGPQLHPWQIWHMTRSRPIEYTCKCGHRVTLVEGFEPEELEDYLIQEGVLIREPLIPGLISERALLPRENANEGTSGDDRALPGMADGEPKGPD